MGKGQHSKDKTYMTATEWQGYGGHKTRREQAVKKLPLTACSLSLAPWVTPVMAPDGVIYEFTNIVPFLRKYGRNPSTGSPLAAKDLVKLHFTKNAAGALIDPVSYEVLTDNTKVVALRTSGNVYSAETVQELNVAAKSWRDLIDSSPFTRADIVILQDTSDAEWMVAHDANNFAHVREGWAAPAASGGAGSSASAGGSASASGGAAEIATAGGTVRLNDTTRRILAEVESKYAGEKRSREEAFASSVASSVNGSSGSAAGGSGGGHGGASTGTGGHVTGLGIKTSGRFTGSFTSSAMTVITRNEAAVETAADRDERRWAWVAAQGRKALVRIVTNKGPLSCELHADLVPRITENFLILASKGYYNGVSFHRLIKNFMIQGGDPTGTGRGGDSAWGSGSGSTAAVKDEFHPRLSHNERGVLSMANAGPDTNRSQFFITLRACTHLDRKHSVFGKLVGGADTLAALEATPTDKTDKPTEPLIMERVEVYQNPFDEYAAAAASVEAAHAAAVTAGTRGSSGSGSSGSGVKQAATARAGEDDDNKPWLQSASSSSASSSSAPAAASAAPAAAATSGSLTQRLAQISGTSATAGGGASASAAAAPPVGARLQAALRAGPAVGPAGSAVAPVTAAAAAAAAAATAAKAVVPSLVAGYDDDEDVAQPPVKRPAVASGLAGLPKASGFGSFASW